MRTNLKQDDEDEDDDEEDDDEEDEEEGEETYDISSSQGRKCPAKRARSY